MGHQGHRSIGVGHNLSADALGLFLHVGVGLFKFLGLFFLSGFDDFSRFMGFGGGWCLDMENENIANGGRSMQQEENQLPMSGYLGLFETCMTEFF